MSRAIKEHIWLLVGLTFISISLFNLAVVDQGAWGKFVDTLWVSWGVLLTVLWARRIL